MANNGIESLAIVLSSYQNGGNVAQLIPNAIAAIGNLGPDEIASVAISASQLLDSAISSIGKSLPAAIKTIDGRIPVAGVLLSSVSALNNVRMILNDVSSGSISKSQAIGAVADAAGAIGGAALALAAVAAGTTGAVATVATVGAILTVASVSLAIASVAVGADRLQVPALLADAISGLNALRDSATSEFDAAYLTVQIAVDSFVGDLTSFGNFIQEAGFPTLLENAGNYWIDVITSTDFYTGTRSRPVPRDPLAIDLDGDGIETVGIVQGATNPVLFDHDADGTRTGTGWLQGDDAWLVLDRDGNGSIDSGRELFGVDTLISGTVGTSSAVYASNGFEALRTLDANGDGVFNASDAAFTQVRLWQDLNQDGISQSNELSTLASQNITGIVGARFQLSCGSPCEQGVTTHRVPPDRARADAHPPGAMRSSAIV